MDDARFKSAVQLASDTRKEVEAAMETSPEALAEGYRKAPAERRPVLLAQLIWCSREIRAAWDGVSLIAQQLLRDGAAAPRRAGLMDGRRAGAETLAADSARQGPGCKLRAKQSHR